MLAWSSAGFKLEEKYVDSHDGHIGALLHLKSGIHETILGNPGIGINQEDDFSATWSAKE